MDHVKIKNNTKGFTLVEMIVTLIITAILAGVVIGGVIAYQRYATFKKNNEYAQTIYTAAQSAFTRAKAGGQLDALAELMEKSEYKVNQFSENMIENGASGFGTGRAYYLFLGPEAPQTAEGEESAYKIVYDMIDDYVYDATILDAVFCVEFDPIDGIILGVCYNDKADSFYYGMAGQAPGKGTSNDISDRSVEARKKMLLGYYGLDDVSDRAPSSLKKTALSNAELVNGDTLYVKWSLTSKYKYMTNQLKYKIQLYNADTKKMAASLEVNNIPDAKNIVKRQNASNVGEDELYIQCNVTIYEEDGKTKAVLKDVRFRAYASENSVMYLVLDAVDLEAASLSEKKDADYGDTYSIKRLGLEGMNLYARVQAGGSFYKSSAWKQTNTENALFADTKTTDDGKTVTYGVKNARHLSNIRFAETNKNDKGRVNETIFLQKADFSWDGENGIISRKSVFNKGKIVSAEKEGKEKAFPPIEEFGEDCKYTAKDEKSGKVYQIQNMLLYEVPVSSKAESKPLGIFRNNAGTVEYVSLKKVQAEGKDYVGTICGLNKGVLRDITTTGVVKGKDYVGGIAGSDITGKKQTANGEEVSLVGTERIYENLKNGASVSGQSYVGGITGYMYGRYRVINAERTLLIQDCKNTGYVEGSGSCIGGIAGYNKLTMIKDCTSNPIPSGEKMAEIEEMAEADTWTGDFVGGIIGLNENAAITGCSTGAGTAKGYVTGRYYVGGIAGINTTTAGTASGLDGDGAVSRTYVMGKGYVGGIVGANATLEGDIQKYLQGEGTIDEIVPAKQHVSSNISNWENTGIVVAAEKYAGGITGYNAGSILDCRTSSDAGSLSGASAMENAYDIAVNGDYAGGVAGYNNGTISGVNSIPVVSIVAGQNYVGGIIGYNDTDAVVTNYMLAGGFIKGNNFVGGYAGVNRSVQLCRESLEANPNLVKGELYIGGILGGNLSALQNLYVNMLCNTDNFLGGVTGTAFVGGFVGYNRNVADGNDGGDLADMAKIYYSEEESSDPYACADYNLLYEKVKSYDDIASAGELFIGSDKIITVNRLGSITGQIHVGGILGYNASGSALYIVDAVNKTPVTAESVIQEDGKAYSYAGGITGLVTEKTWIMRCSNDSSARISSEGTYLGGIAERCKGAVNECTVSAVGSSDRDYVGGIVGRNDTEGSLASNVILNTVTGHDYVGGMAAENFGTIRGKNNSQYNFTVQVSGNYAGGVAGWNHKGAVIQEHIFDSGYRLESEGNYAGGLIGLNEGDLNNCSIKSSAMVRGDQYVGGLVGSQQGGVITESVNGASATAEQGYSGGIAGEIINDSLVDSCTNTGDIRAERSGDAGGITAILEQGARINTTKSTGNVISSNGNAAGIAALNYGEITAASASGTITALNDVGGIAAINDHVIKESDVSRLTYTSVAGSSNSRIGGTTVLNTENGVIENCTVGKDGKVAISAKAAGGYYGGLAGINRGTVKGSSAGNLYTKVSADINADTSDSAISAYMGGITGLNEGTISFYSYSGTITGDGGSVYGYGGIAGSNENSITDCMAEGVKITTNGAANDPVSAGGIAGQNGLDARISHCNFKSGEIKAKVYGHVGGMAGTNQGTVSENKCMGGTVSLTISQGNIGGLVGVNESSALVAESSTGGKEKDGNEWNVSATSHATDNAIGGIIGYNHSSKSLDKLVNYADVNKDISGNNISGIGGLVGRQENQLSDSWVMKECVNYGDIKGPIAVGGMIGRWKYKGGTILNCENYGRISARQSRVGGMVGDCYAIDSGQTLDMIQCKNQGVLAGTEDIGGMIGMATAVPSVEIYMNFYQCVNIGLIQASSETGAGGIAGNLANTKAEYNIIQCRNYGLSEKKMSGIVGATSAENTVIKDCFGVADCSAPVTKASVKSVNSSYYFDNSLIGVLGDKSSRLYVKKEGDVYTAYNAKSGNVLTGLRADPTSSVYNDKTDTGVKRLELYNTIDSQLLAYYEQKYGNAKLNNPTNVNRTDEGGSYQLSWNKDASAYYYEVKAELFDSGESTNPVTQVYQVYGANSYNISIEDDWDGKYLQLSVRAVSGKEEYNSDWVLYKKNGESKLPVAPFLATPQVHMALELEGAQKGGYRFVLENKDDYPQEVQKNIVIHTTVGGIDYTFTAEQGESDTLYNKDLGANTIVINYAEYIHEDGKYSNSIKYSRQTWPMSYTELNNKETAEITFSNFSGSLTGSVAYDLKAKEKNGTQVIYRAEMLAYDADLNMQVAVSSAVARLTEGLSVIQLTNLPDEIQEPGTNVTVRCYPWRSQNNVAFYADKVAGNLTAEEVRNMKAIYDTSGNLKGGYVIERTEDGKYEVIYSPLVAYGFTKQVKSSELTVPNKKKPDRQPAPVLSGSYKEEEGIYTFSWDEGSSGGSYNVLIIGIPFGSNKEVQLKTEDTTKHSIEMDGSTWNYSEIKVSVTRLGTKDGDKITKFSNRSMKSYQMTLRLSKITQPSVELEKDEHGETNKNELRYSVAWRGYQDENMLKDLDTYVIYAKDVTEGKAEENKVKTAAWKSSDTSAVIDLEAFAGCTVEIYVNGLVKADAEHYRNSFDGISYSFDVPTRKAGPSENIISLDKSASDILDSAAFEDEGVRILAADPDRTGAGKYEIRLALYEKSGQQEETAALGDFVMNGSLKDSSFNLNRDSGLLKEYAGYYLGVKVRTISDNEISSKWSAEKRFPLPKMRLDAVQLTEEQILRKCSQKVTMVGGMVDDTEISVEQNALTWSDIEFSEGYSILTSTKDGKNYDLRLVKGDDKPYMLSKKRIDDNTGKEYWEEQDLISAESEQTENGTVKTTYSFAFGYEHDIINQSVMKYETKVKGFVEFIQYTKDAESWYTFQIILPDITTEGGFNEVAGDYENDPYAYLFTSEVTITALTNDAQRYTDANQMKWQRKQNEETGNWETKIEEQKPED